MKVTIYRVDSLTGGDPCYLPLKSMAEVWGRMRGWEYDRKTSRTVIDGKGPLCKMLAKDALAERQIGAFLQKWGYWDDGERYE